jgi:hypothetical protein
VATGNDDEPVTRAEMKGLWLQSDLARDGLQGVLKAQQDNDLVIAGMSKDVAWIKRIVAVPSAIALVVLLRVLWVSMASDPYMTAMLAMVTP